ncbi:MAG: DUF547 domain-containing protein [Chloroflexi bacterium]|nr:MAG: DUF547 domain-containing protein [Chloroflexota bacterium]
MPSPMGLTPEAFSYDSWDALLREVVTPDGRVDYPRLAERRDVLGRFIAELRAASPESDPGRFPTPESRLAYWLNAYNAFTLDAIIAEYPIRSVWKTRDGQFFQRRRHLAGGRAVSLDDIEHEILRGTFGEPRIHFAINCGSNGCPPLRPTRRCAPPPSVSSPTSGTCGSTTRRGASSSRASSRCTPRTSRGAVAPAATIASACCASSRSTGASRSRRSPTTRSSTTSTTGA